MNRAAWQFDEPHPWTPVPLGEYFAGVIEPPAPEWLHRPDGQALAYPGKTALLYGEPEAGKSWLALRLCADVMAAGATVAFFDYEDDAQTITSRLRLLGVDETTAVERFRYYMPAGRYDATADELVTEMLGHGTQLVVIDSVGAGMSASGLDPLSNRDAADWMRTTVQALRYAANGAAALLLDHVVKAAEARGRGPIGAQAKLAAVDVAYALEVGTPFGDGRDGSARLIVHKDRPGALRRHTTSRDRLADIHYRSRPGRLEVVVDLPDGDGKPFRPTVLMARAHAALDAAPEPLGVRQWLDLFAGKSNATKQQAIAALVSEGFVSAEVSGQRRLHKVVRPWVDLDRI